VYSKHEGKEFGSFVRTAGKFFNDETEDKGKKLIFINEFPQISVAVNFPTFYTYVSFPLITNTWKRHVRERMEVLFIAFYNHVCQSHVGNVSKP
jgi:hypothetical protein